MVVENRDIKNLGALTLLFIVVCGLCQVLVTVCASIFQNMTPDFLPAMTWRIFRHEGWIVFCPLPWLMWLGVLWRTRGPGQSRELSERVQAIFIWTVWLAAMGMIGLIGASVVRPLYAFAINNYTALL